MNSKTKNNNIGRNGGTINDEFLFRFRGVPDHLAQKIIRQEKIYRKQQLKRKRRKSDYTESKHQSHPGNNVPASEYAGTVL
jgi:hypothetical protein